MATEYNKQKNMDENPIIKRDTYLPKFLEIISDKIDEGSEKKEGCVQREIKIYKIEFEPYE